MFELHLDHSVLVQYAVHFMYFVIKASSPDDGFNIVHVQVPGIATLFLTFWFPFKFLSLLKHWFYFLFRIPNTIFSSRLSRHCFSKNRKFRSFIFCFVCGPMNGKTNKDVDLLADSACH